MALQFVMGPPGSGKSHYLYQKVTEESLQHPEEQFVVIVPDQFTMQTQKDLVMASPRKGILNVDVLSFGRLAHRIFAETGGQQQIVLDDVGKSFILRKVAGKLGDHLRVLGSNLKKPGYIGEMKSVISEFAQYDIQKETLDALMEEVGSESNLYYKLQDIQQIYAAFQEYLSGKYITGEELLEVLCSVVGESEILRDSTVVLDGFTGFTPVQNKLLRELMRICKKIVVTVTIGEHQNPFSYKHPYQLFALSKQMVTSLVDIAKETGTTIEEPVYLFEKPLYRFREHEALGFLEANLFRYQKQSYEKPQEEIQVFCAQSPREEVDFVAQRIRKLVRTKGYRYREIAIIASDMSTYGSQIEKACEAYEIPVFMDQKRSILLNSFVEYVRSLLAMVQQNFSYESVFRYLRTGLAGFTQEEIDIVENYVIALGVRGYQSWQDVWVRRSYRMDEEELAQLNGIRSRFIEQIAEVTEVLKRKHKTVLDVTEALYMFLVKENLQKKVMECRDWFENNSELALAKEYDQIFEIVITLFDKLVELLGTERISIKEYGELLDAGFEEAKVGVIPPKLDQIVVGDIERTRVSDVKVLFLLGANDRFLSGGERGGGLLSEHDRDQFKKNKIALAPGAKEKVFIQKFYLYLLMTKPSDQLFISLSKVSLDGKTIYPAYLISDLKRLYPGLAIQDVDGDPNSWELTPARGMERLIAGLQKKEHGFDAQWKELYQWYRKRPEWKENVERIVDACFYERPHDQLTEQTAKKLYGTILENSVTRLEKFSACAYAHFLTYGLQLQDREEYVFQPVDWGNVFHRSLEQFACRLEQEGFTWLTVPKECLDEWIEECVEESINYYGSTILYSTARNEYIIDRMKRMLHRTVWALQKQMEKGDFVPVGYEISFGGASNLSTSDMELDGHGRMRLRGKIDRVDLYEDEDHVLVKVMDYKTGKKTFDLGELYYGLQLQLILYLNAALELEEKKHPGKKVIPAGIFYYRMNDPVLERDTAMKDGVEDATLKELRLDGIVNADDDAVEHLDRTLSGSSIVVPVGRTKSGAYTKASKIATAEELQLISEYAKRRMKQIGTQILQGEACISPYEMNQNTGCMFCPYRSVCGFEETIPGYAYRTLPKMKYDDVIKKMREEAETWE